MHVTHRLQLLTFFLENDARPVIADILQVLLSSLNSLLTHESQSVQAWSLIAISTACKVLHPLLSAEKAAELALKSAISDQWQRAWNVALRFFSNVSLSRPACLLLHTFVRASAIEHDQIIRDLEAVARDIEIQGPSFPSDTVCDLLTLLLKLTSSDLRLHQLNIREKIFHRLSSHWTLLQNSSPTSLSFTHKARSDRLSTSRFMRLLMAMSSIPLSVGETFEETILPDCAVALYGIKRAEEHPLQNWYFHAKLPTVDSPRSTNPGYAGKDVSTTPEALPLASSNVCATRLVAYLRRALDHVLEELVAGDEIYWAVLTVDRMRRMLDLAVVSLVYEVTLDTYGINVKDKVFSLAVELLQLLVPKISLTKLSSSERALLLLSFSPLLVNYQK